MKILNLDGTVGSEQAHPLDNFYKPRKTFATAFFSQADGQHGFYILPDGKTVEHYLLPRQTVEGLFAKADPNFKPENKTGITPSNIGDSSQK